MYVVCVSDVSVVDAHIFAAAPTRRVACERRPPKPHRLPDSTTSGAAAAAPTAPLQEAVGAAHHAAAGTAQSQACAERCRSHAAAQAPGCSAPEPAAQAQSQPHTEPASCSGRPGADCNGYQGATGGEDGAAAGEADRTCRGRSRSRSRSRSIRSSSSCSSGSCASGALLADFAAAAAAGSRGGADEGEEEDGGGGCAGPSYEQCWSRDGPGPAAEQLLRKLRWATLGPQFDWTERQYDFTGAYRWRGRRGLEGWGRVGWGGVRWLAHLVCSTICGLQHVSLRRGPIGPHMDGHPRQRLISLCCSRYRQTITCRAFTWLRLQTYPCRSCLLTPPGSCLPACRTWPGRWRRWWTHCRRRGCS